MSRIGRIALVSVSLMSSLLMGQETPKIKRVPASANTTIQGQELFRIYCAVCHGTDGKGGGPAAAALKTMPTDLTQLAAKNAGKYPDLRVRSALSGEEPNIPAHGSKDMPMWGPVLRHVGSNPDLGSIRVYNLVQYVESLQAK